MKHYWINLEKSKNRRKFMEDQFKKIDLEHHRVNAISPDDFDNVLANKRPLTCKHHGCTTCEYEFACLCSHIEAMRIALMSDDDIFVIMEDDVNLACSIYYENILKVIPSDFEILQLLILYDGTIVNLYDYFKKTGNMFIKWRYLLPSTGMYIITRKGAEKLVNQFYNTKTKMFDFSSSPYQIVADVLLYETLNTYATTLPYAYPLQELGSEIHPDHLSSQQKATNVIKTVLQDIKILPYSKTMCLTSQ